MELTLEEQVGKVAEFCSSMPIGARSLDYFNPESWPTPWEILYHSSFCTSSISLLIFYTLVIVNPDINIEMWLVKDNSGDYLLPVINDQFVLNYQHGTVSKCQDIQEYFVTMQKYSKSQIKSIT